MAHPYFAPVRNAEQQNSSESSGKGNTNSERVDGAAEAARLKQDEDVEEGRGVEKAAASATAGSPSGGAV